MSESIFNFFTTTKNSILEQQILMSKVDNVEDKFIDLYKKSFENVKSYFYLLKDQTFGSAESARLTEASASILPSIFTCMLKNCNDKDKDEIQKILKNYKHNQINHILNFKKN